MKDGRTFRHCPNFTGETKLVQVIEKPAADVLKDRLPTQIFDLRRLKANSFKIIESLLQTRSNKVASLGR